MRPVEIWSETRKLANLAAPIAAAQAGMALMGLVDTAVVGRLGAGPLGAVGLANGLFFAIAVVGIGVMVGLDPLIAQAFGAGERGRARELLWQSLWLALLVSAVLSVPIALSPALWRPAELEPFVAKEARAFLLLRLPGLFPMLLFVGLRSYLQAAGIVRPLLITTVLANLLNFLGDLLFVYGGAQLPTWTGPLRLVPAFGAPGAGLCTSVCSVVPVGVLLLATRALKAGRVRRGPHGSDLLKAIKVGLPVGLHMGAEVGVFALVGILAGSLGKESIAAHQVALSLASLTFCFALGLGNAGSVRVGWSVGAGDTQAARRSGLVAFGVGATFMAFCACIFLLFPGPLVGLFSGRSDVRDAAVPLLAVAAFFQISDGVQGVGAGVLRGAGDTRFTFYANIVGHYLLGLPVAVLLGFVLRLGVYGLWWGLCAGLTAVAISLFLRFWALSSRTIVRLEPAIASADRPASLEMPPV